MFSFGKALATNITCKRFFYLHEQLQHGNLSEDLLKSFFWHRLHWNGFFFHEPQLYMPIHISFRYKARRANATPKGLFLMMNRIFVHFQVFLNFTRGASTDFVLVLAI